MSHVTGTPTKALIDLSSEQSSVLSLFLQNPLSSELLLCFVTVYIIYQCVYKTKSSLLIREQDIGPPAPSLHQNPQSKEEMGQGGAEREKAITSDRKFDTLFWAQEAAREERGSEKAVSRLGKEVSLHQGHFSRSQFLAAYQTS